jgi:PhnB protein
MDGWRRHHSAKNKLVRLLHSMDRLGEMKITLHVSFPGNCEAAFRFYQSCLGGEITTLLTWGASPISGMVPAEWREKICHAALDLGTSVLAGVDPPPADYVRPGGFQILLEMEDIAKAEEVFKALGEDGTVTLPLQQTFWAERFGVLIDKFGVQWEIQSQANPK